MTKSKFITVNAILIALIMALIAIPISIGPVRLAVLMLIPVIISAVNVNLASSFVTSIALGLISLATSLLFPISPLSILFRNPLISVLPRLFIGPMAFIVYRGATSLFNKLSKGGLKHSSLRQIISITLATVVAVCVNTFLVISMLFAVYYNREVAGQLISKGFLTALISINFVIELVVCAIIAPPICMALKKLLSTGQASSLKTKSEPQQNKANS